MDLAAVKLDFQYDDWFTKEPNVGYETLLYDVMIGDPTLFMARTWRSRLGASYNRCLMLGPERTRRICR